MKSWCDRLKKNRLICKSGHRLGDVEAYLIPNERTPSFSIVYHSIMSDRITALIIPKEISDANVIRILENPFPIQISVIKG